MGTADMADKSRLLASTLALLLGTSVALAGPATYPTPEAATEAFVAALQAQDRAALLVVFGPKAEDLISSGDPDSDAAAREEFLAGYTARHKIVAPGEGRADLQIGNSPWTFRVAL